MVLDLSDKTDKKAPAGFFISSDREVRIFDIYEKIGGTQTHSMHLYDTTPSLTEYLQAFLSSPLEEHDTEVC